MGLESGSLYLACGGVRTGLEGESPPEVIDVGESISGERFNKDVGVVGSGGAGGIFTIDLDVDKLGREGGFRYATQSVSEITQSSRKLPSCFSNRC